MRVLCLLVLLAVGAVVIVFAAQNQQEVTLTFLNYNRPINVALLIGVAYGLGMVSGWTVVGLLRRSFQRVTEIPPSRQQAAW
jgi:uncharacterized membrane protein YciS (DUF1049 family)